MHQTALFQETKSKCFSLQVFQDKTAILKAIHRNQQTRASKSKTQTTQV